MSDRLLEISNIIILCALIAFFSFMFGITMANDAYRSMEYKPIICEQCKKELKLCYEGCPTFEALIDCQLNKSLYNLEANFTTLKFEYK